MYYAQDKIYVLKYCHVNGDGLIFKAILSVGKVMPSWSKSHSSLSCLEVYERITVKTYFPICLLHNLIIYEDVKFFIHKKSSILMNIVDAVEEHHLVMSIHFIDAHLYKWKIYRNINLPSYKNKTKCKFLSSYIFIPEVLTIIWNARLYNKVHDIS